jgi:beta-glucosidase
MEMNWNRRTLVGAGAALAAMPLTGAKAASAKAKSFPKGFIWGGATAGHQVEGNNVNSDFWVAETVKPTIFADPSGDADNSFELWPSDLDLVKSLGLNTYRFSLEWSRIEPEPGMFSIAMLDHYKAMIDGCRARGLTPMVTFSHFTTPRWFAARGGWTNPDAPELFGRFCDRAARHLAGGIAYAMTLNEPNDIRDPAGVAKLALIKPRLDAMIAAAAKAVGSDRFVFANLGVTDFDQYTKTLIAAHKAGRAAIKAARSDLPVGVTLAMPDDQAVGPDSMRDTFRAQAYLPWLEAARSDDFLGVQNYERQRWDAKGKLEPEPGGLRNAGGGEVYPASLANAVRYAYSLAKVPIIVTEHGINTHDDALRVDMIKQSLAELKRAMDEGVPVKGYVHWSLLDNFEWISGYKHQYGLVAVDRTTFRRTPKPSAKVLGAIARANALPGA